MGGQCIADSLGRCVVSRGHNVTVKFTCKDSSLLFVFVMCQELWSVEELQSVSDVVREYRLCWLIVVWHSLNRGGMVLGRDLRTGPQCLYLIL